MFRDHKFYKLALVFIVLASLLAGRYTLAKQDDGKAEMAKDATAEDSTKEGNTAEDAVTESNTEEGNTSDGSTADSIQTAKAYIGDFTQVSSLKNMQLMPLKATNVTIEDNKGYLVEIMVNWGEFVKKDQPLLSYTVPVDELALEEKEMALKKNEENYKKTLEDMEQNIEDSTNSMMASNSSSIEAQINLLNIEKQKISLEQYKYQTERSLEKQKEELDELKADQEIKYLKAPFDGIIYWFDNSLKKGALLEQGTDLIYMADINSAVLQAESAGAANLWYNLEVTINPIINKKEDTSKGIKGRVVAIDSLLNGEAKTGMIYIKPDSISQEMASPGQRANITAVAIKVKNVLLVPSRAVKSDNGGLKYVNIIDDKGEKHKQYISGRDNGNETWVYNGLSEGQEIVIE